ncbi:P1 family peptidase, partial [Eubacteriales bacterium DFI.9.88]|nr:P1 family peptidase [Eubacteriales bacterium DFI.9.88]
GEEIDECGYIYPVVGETWDGLLNDINGFHVKEEHVYEALNNAKAGPVAEGNVGGGTGLVWVVLFGGTGTASRVLPKEFGGYTVGALVQANHGIRM